MAYQIAAMEMTLNDLEGHLPVAGLFKCNPSNICAAFYTISTDSVLAQFLCISRPSCFGNSNVLTYFTLRTRHAGAAEYCFSGVRLCVSVCICS